MTDAAALLAVIREHHGAERMAAGMISTGVAAAMVLSRDPAALVVRLVRAIAYDHGERGWAWREVGSGGGGDGSWRRTTNKRATPNVNSDWDGDGDEDEDRGGERRGEAAPAARMPDTFGSVEGLRTSCFGARSAPAHPHSAALSAPARASDVVFEMATSRRGYTTLSFGATA
jgi:hypothetical protein